MPEIHPRSRKRALTSLLSLGLSVTAALLIYSHATAGGMPRPGDTDTDKHSNERIIKELKALKLGPGEYVRIPSPMITVPLTRLIATPERYDGKRVNTIGYVELNWEDSHILPYKEDAENGVIGNGIALNLMDAQPNKDPSPKNGDIHDIQPLDQLQGKYCLIEGVFNAHNGGHLGMWQGTIDKINRMEVWPPSRRSDLKPTSPIPAKPSTP